MTVCVVHQDHEAEEGWLCCRGAWGRLAGALRRIPELCGELARQEIEIGVLAPDPVSLWLPAGPTRPSWSASRIRSTRPERLPVRADCVDLLWPVNHGAVALRARGALGLDDDQHGYVSVSTVLDDWIIRVSRWQGLRAPHLGRERSLVSAQCGWLFNRLDKICNGFPELAEFAEEIREVSSTLYGLCGHPAARPKIMDAPCPTCGIPNLIQYYPDAYIECECGRVLTPEEYAEHVRSLIEEQS